MSKKSTGVVSFDVVKLPNKISYARLYPALSYLLGGIACCTVKKLALFKRLVHNPRPFADAFGLDQQRVARSGFLWRCAKVRRQTREERGVERSVSAVSVGGEPTGLVQLLIHRVGHALG